MERRRLDSKTCQTIHIIRIRKRYLYSTFHTKQCSSKCLKPQMTFFFQKEAFWCFNPTTTAAAVVEGFIENNSKLYSLKTFNGMHVSARKRRRRRRRGCPLYNEKYVTKSISVNSVFAQFAMKLHGTSMEKRSGEWWSKVVSNEVKWSKVVVHLLFVVLQRGQHLFNRALHQNPTH